MMPMSSANPLSFRLMKGTKIVRSPADRSQKCNAYYLHPGTLKSPKIRASTSCFYPYIRISPSIHHSLLFFVGWVRLVHPSSFHWSPTGIPFLLILCSILGPMPSPRVVLKQRLSRCFRRVCARDLAGDCGGCSNVGCTPPWVHHSVSTSGRIGVHWPEIHWPNASLRNKEIAVFTASDLYMNCLENPKKVTSWLHKNGCLGWWNNIISQVKVLESSKPIIKCLSSSGSRWIHELNQLREDKFFWGGVRHLHPKKKPT